MNDRTIDGKKALHLEEIQSDWHQQGREKGYKLPPDQVDKLEPEFNRIDDKIVNSGDEEVMGNPDINKAVKLATDRNIITPEEAKTYLRYSDSQRYNAVPDAPFKKTWLDLALKRVIREAAEKGYDRISWTPGEAQAARYDLSKQVDELRLIPKNKWTDPNFEYRLDAHKDGNRILEKGVNNQEDLSNIIGKEPAEKLFSQMNSLEKKDTVKISGQDLKIGGEGMHYFYDKMVPKALEKLTGEKTQIGDVNTTNIKKEYKIRQESPYDFVVYGDGERLNSSTSRERAQQYIDGRRAGEKEQAEDPNSKIPYINLPQSVKDTALHKGFPLFSNGLMLSPVNSVPGLTPLKHNPFSVGNDSDPEVNNRNDVPYLAGASNTPTGYPVNIDRRMPRYDPEVLDKTGKPADLWRPLKKHEIAEYQDMQKKIDAFVQENGRQPNDKEMQSIYLDSHHNIAIPAEKAELKEMGVNEDKYNHVMDGYLSEIEHENPKNPPVNLYDKPYPHDKQKLLEKNEANE
jgi:hypothetical protein